MKLLERILLNNKSVNGIITSESTSCLQNLRHFLILIKFAGMFRPLKKLLAYIVLILFTYNLAGYYVVFKGWQKGIRSQIKEQIRHDSKLSDIEVLTFSKADLKQKRIALEWEKEDEFRFNGNMYDVVSRNESSDSITFTCINDRKEKKLIDQFQAFVNQQHNNVPSKHSNPFKILENLVKDYCTQQAILQNCKEGIIIYKPELNVYLPNTYIEVLSPPPRMFV